MDLRCTVFSLSPLALSVQGMTYAITVMLMTQLYFVIKLSDDWSDVTGRLEPCLSGDKRMDEIKHVEIN